MKKMMALLLALCFSVALFSCGKTENEDVTVKVVTLMGPTGMGMVQLMQNDKDGTSANDYEFTLASSPEEAQSAIASVDIAALPVNLAAALYNKGEDISFAAINTLNPRRAPYTVPASPIFCFALFSTCFCCSLSSSFFSNEAIF